MSRDNGVLVAPLTHRWFVMIDSLQKDEEYRKDKPGKELWAKRLLTKMGLQVYRKNPEWLEPHHFQHYHTFRGSDGYTWTERPIVRTRWGTPRPEWSGDTVTGSCFVIELGRP